MAVNATAVWRVRPSGSNTNGGGYDPGIAGAATDYSQQNAAQASGTHGATTGTTTFTDLTALAFTPVMVGNSIYITGTGQTTGWYFVTAFSSSSVVTLDRSPGTGTLATWNLGGGWADPVTNTTGASSPLVSLNTVYILGSGTPNPASYTYDYTVSTSAAPGSGANLEIIIANDPSTPGFGFAPITTGGMPCIKFTGSSVLAGMGSMILVSGLWFVAGSTVSAGSYATQAVGYNGISGTVRLNGCVLDQFGKDVGLGGAVGNATGNQSAQITAVGCEVFSSQGGSGGTNAGFFNNGTPGATLYILKVIGCNIHDCVGYGIYWTVTASFISTWATITDSIISKCSSSGIYYDAYYPLYLKNCTIDGNGGDGLTVGSLLNTLYNSVVTNNIFSNQTGVGKYGLNADFSNYVFNFLDYNTYYNNTADTTFGYNDHDTHGGANPYVNQATENYALA